MPTSTGTGAITAGPITAHGVGVASIHTSPSTLPVNDPHQQNIRLALVGAGWTAGGTTFSVSGVTGVSALSQSVTSGQFATITVSTPGVTAGTLTISDGTYTGTVKVKATRPTKMRFFNGLFVPSPTQRDRTETAE